MDALVVGEEQTVFWQSVLLLLPAQVSKYTLNQKLFTIQYKDTVLSLILGPKKQGFNFGQNKHH